MKPALSYLEALARQAGAILCAYFGQQLVIDHKGVIDLVTEADRSSESYIMGEIQQHFPNHRIVAEESGVTQGLDDQVWYVDPLDGTVNFAHGLPIYSISLAYAQGGVMEFGVVYDPSRDECFSAARGRGAWLNGQPICVSQTLELDQSLLVTGFPYDIRTNPINNLENYTRFALRSQAVRRLGSAALDLCYVGMGRFDGYWEIRLNPWDVAAGGLIATEAGGRVTNLSGGEDYLSVPQSILAANPSIHQKMLAVLQSV
jgi:myo-inositol-1(or 4)-monophosphatase